MLANQNIVYAPQIIFMGTSNNPENANFVPTQGPIFNESQEARKFDPNALDNCSVSRPFLI